MSTTICCAATDSIQDARSSLPPATLRATRRTRAASSNDWSSGGARVLATGWQLLFRPHPRDGLWRQRFAAAAGHDGIFVQEASYSDIDDLATLLQHVDVLVCNAGTILLDALVGDRPAVCVLYDEGAPPGESWAAKNIVGKHYEELATSGAFYPAESFEEVVAGIERALVHPHELAETRRRAVADIVGVVDGHAAERVVASILEAVRISPAGVPEAPADD